MNCKNCKKSLITDYNFCPNCGAKVIRNRLTLKNLTADFTSRFLNVNNTIFQTFLHLFTKPDVVIKGYINGVRKKYINPISYFAFSIILSGLMFFVLKKIYKLTLMDSYLISGGSKADVLFDYQGLMTYVSLPIFAFISWLIFIDKRKYNFTEHVVINMYIIAHYAIVQFVIYLIVLGLFNVGFTTFSNYAAAVILTYTLYVLKKLHQLNFKQIVLRGLMYIPLYFIGTTIATTPFIIYLLYTGQLELSDLAPKP
ncbi:DUF3667 domain-containing protein [Aurantibacter sp.]|uniref:DUF3667 domain-containing protein n=1 Tax=Aurantibacter sp. TaxID=2807103 RepID=UPI00326645A6